MRPAVSPSGVSLGNSEIRPEGDCPVCGVAVRPPVRACPTCATPHHLDCWTYNAGCAIFGCAAHPPAPVRVRETAPDALEQLPEKILLPQVAMAFFSGIHYFPPWGALWCMFWVIFAPFFQLRRPDIALASYALCALGFLAGGLWSDRYNLDLKKRAITRSWLIGPFELVEAVVAPFDNVVALWIGEPGDHNGAVALHAWVHGHGRVYLTPGLPIGSDAHAESRKLLEKLNAFSVLPVAVQAQIPEHVR